MCTTLVKVLLAKLFICSVVVTGRPLKSEAKKEAGRGGPEDPISYLLKFGYVDNLVTLRRPNGSTVSSAALLGANSPEIGEAVRRFQDFAGLPVTGRLDRETLETMAMPRCGVRDRQMPEVKRRFRRYVTHGSRWDSGRRLTYAVGRYPVSPRLSRSDVDRVLDLAFRLWAWPRSPLAFARAPSASSADIRIDFFSGAHGVGDQPFDGRGGVLAHAFFPRFGGDVHFDEDEDWAVRRREDAFSTDPKQLLQTAAHEIGHSLGLQHSKVRDLSSKQACVRNTSNSRNPSRMSIS